jgi:hypothetical protein
LQGAAGHPGMQDRDHRGLLVIPRQRGSGERGRE